MKHVKSLSAPFIIVFIIFIFQSVVFGQATYDIYKVDPASPIEIDGQVDAVWNSVKMDTCLKLVENQDRTTDKNPPPEDYSIEFGALWDDKGLYFLVRIVDDLLVFDNLNTADWNGTQVPSAQWWKDDNFSFLFTSDLQPAVGQEPWEFAWLVNNDVEVKASYELQVVLPELIQTAWIDEGNNTYTAEVFISWDAFLGFSNYFPIEVRGRDDDEPGTSKYPQTFFQWNTHLKEVEKNSELMGGAILLEENVPTSVKQINTVPSVFSLSQNYPNPFNPTTKIDFNLLKPGQAKLQVYDTAGRLVSTLVNGVLQAGMHNVTFDASDLPSGVYFYKIESGEFSQMKKMMLIR